MTNERDGAGFRELRAFVAHLWDECHDGGDFEKSRDAAKLDALLASPLHAGADAIPKDWEGDLPTEHLNRCKRRDNLLYSDMFNDDGSHRRAWRCHKREGHDGPCSSHNDCGVMSGSVVCGHLPGHSGPHAWETRIALHAGAEPEEAWQLMDRIYKTVVEKTPGLPWPTTAFYDFGVPILRAALSSSRTAPEGPKP